MALPWPLLIVVASLALAAGGALAAPSGVPDAPHPAPVALGEAPSGLWVCVWPEPHVAREPCR